VVLTVLVPQSGAYKIVTFNLFILFWGGGDGLNAILAFNHHSLVFIYLLYKVHFVHKQKTLAKEILYCSIGLMAYTANIPLVDCCCKNPPPIGLFTLGIFLFAFSLSKLQIRRIRILDYRLF
jgi:hypothetical protein